MGTGTQAMTADPHSADRLILIGCHNALARPSALRLMLMPDDRKQWLNQVLAFLNDTVKYDSTSTSVFVQPEYQKWPETDQVIALVHAHYKQARINSNTVEAVTARRGLNLIRNLRLIADNDYRGFRDVRQNARSMVGKTALIVGAGVSFERDADVVAQHRGPIIAVNTSAGACAQRSVFPQLVICTESKPVVEGISRMNHGRSQLAMDITGHPDNWPRVDGEAPIDNGPNLCFVGTESNLMPYAYKLGLMPLAYGSSCTTAAVSLALAMGAERVALVGQDCAFDETEDQGPNEDLGEAWRYRRARMYASGTPYEETTVVIDTHADRVRISKPTVGEYELDALAVEPVSGLARAWTTHSMLSFAHWFRDQPPDVRAKLFNCTSSGVRIEGIAHAPLAQMITTDGERHRRSDNIRGQLECLHFRDKAQRLSKHFRRVAEYGLTIKRETALMEWTRKHPIFAMWTAPERLRMRRMDDLSPEERGRRVLAVVRTACEEILSVGGSSDDQELHHE